MSENTDKYPFSPNLFWDVNVSSLDMKKNNRFIIQRVLEYGTLSGWKIIKNCYGINKIIKEMQKARVLDNTSLSTIKYVKKTYLHQILNAIIAAIRQSLDFYDFIICA